MTNKIVSLNELADQIAQAKAEGKTVAHCHGCFDLLHLGHIKHFEAAKKHADVLVVTLTADKHVNKGPGRPVFNQDKRAETISALGVVDFVAVNPSPTAIEALTLLKPTFYIKGQDYKNFEEDLTGNIKREVAAVRAGGGDILFTEEETFSSSSLINNYFNPLGESGKQYILDLKRKFSISDIIEQIDSLSKLNVLIIGDTIIDEYHYVHSLGKSSKSPTLSTKYIREEVFAGGVLAVANHVNQFANKVTLATILGEENPRMDIIDKKVNSDIETQYFYRKKGPTPTKRRYMTEYLNSKIFEVTFMDDTQIPTELESSIIAFLEEVKDKHDIILVTDFGHGCISNGVKEYICSLPNFVSINAQTNSNNFGFNYITKYHDVNYISIDEKELRLPFGDRYGDLEKLVEELYTVTKCPYITITLGQNGSLVYHDEKFHYAPALATSVVDSVGAGDAVLSITTLCTFLEMDPDLTNFIGNCTGALAVQILGNERPVGKVELNKMLSHILK